MMTQQQITLVQKTWKVFQSISPEVIGDVFYTKLFTDMPLLRPMFKGDMDVQYKKLVNMLSAIVERLHNLDEATEGIKEMARRHVGYGVKDGHYKVVGNALLWTLEQGMGKDWNVEIETAWQTCYDMLADTMIRASKQPAKKL